MTAGGASLLGILGLGLRLGGALLVRAAAGTAAVELDAIAGAGDAVAFARSGARGAGHAAGRRGGAAGAGRGERGAVGVGGGVGLVVVEGGVTEAAGELSERGLGVVGLDEVGGLAGALGLGALNGSGGQSAALRHVAGVAAGRTLGRAGAGRLAGWDIEDVELAAGGGLDGELARGIVGDVIAVHHVVEPVALALLQDGALEAESSSPGTGLLGRGVAGQGKLALITVPGADEVDGLDIGGGAKSKVKLNSGHYC